MPAAASTIREALAPDAAQLIELDRALVMVGRGMVLSLDQLPAEDALRARLQQVAAARAAGRASASIVAEHAGRIVGAAELRQLEPARCAHVGLLSVGVHPHFQRRGIARALMERLIADAEERGISRLELYVRSDNSAAQALYRSLGFHHEGTRRGFVRLDDGSFIDDFIFARVAPGTEPPSPPGSAPP